ncbi:hypothetical protein [Virgibacillus kimchii]
MELVTGRKEECFSVFLMTIGVIPEARPSFIPDLISKLMAGNIL